MSVQKTEPHQAGRPAKKKRRVYNPALIHFRRGRPAGFNHNLLLHKIIEALKTEGPLWYDHLFFPHIPIQIEPVPVRLKHFSPSPDVVIKLGKNGEEMFMIHIQRVYPILKKRRTKKQMQRDKKNGKNHA